MVLAEVDEDFQRPFIRRPHRLDVVAERFHEADHDAQGNRVVGLVERIAVSLDRHTSG
jgi:hypothetical protein